MNVVPPAGRIHSLNAENGREGGNTVIASMEKCDASHASVGTSSIYVPPSASVKMCQCIYIINNRDFIVRVMDPTRIFRV